MDHTQYLKQSRVLDWHHQPGVRPSLPINVPETTTTVNVNILRWDRGLGATLGSRDVCLSRVYRGGIGVECYSRV